MLAFRYLVAYITCMILVISISGCIGSGVKRNTPGPGGLPRGIVDEGAPLEPDLNYPIYPDSRQRASGVYESDDFVTKVRDYYSNLLGIEPTTSESSEGGEILTYETEEFILVLLSYQSNGSVGTEIRFTPVGESS